MRESERHIAAVTAALQVLDAFEGAEELRLSVLHQRTGLAKSRLLRLVGTLEAAGYLTVDEQQGTCTLGPQIYRLAWLARESVSGLIRFSRPRLDLLSSATGATAFLSVIRGQSRLVLAKSEPSTGVRYSIAEGQLRGLNVGATGVVLLAFASDTLRAAVFDHGNFEALTSATITDPAALKRRLDDVAAQGFATSIGEGAAGVLAVSVPVMTPRNELVGALTVASAVVAGESPAERFRDELLKEAHYMSGRIGDASSITSKGE